jgi:hypothetical protein
MDGIDPQTSKLFKNEKSYSLVWSGSRVGWIGRLALSLVTFSHSQNKVIGGGRPEGYANDFFR